MDLITLLSAVPVLGPALPYLMAAGVVASGVATLLPAPSANAGTAYKAVYSGVNWLALNIGHAKNAGTETPPKA